MSNPPGGQHPGPVTEAAPIAAEAGDAWHAAGQAAARGGFTVREVTEPADHRAVERLLREIWETGKSATPMPGDVLRMLSYTGAYVAAADCDGELIGAAVGFLTGPRAGLASTHLHSHIAGVASGHRGRHVGFALKLHQRAWALERGFDRITWTFDPLVRRNAYFNLAKLRARVSRYLVDFYGDMPDGINAGQGSDRILVDWWLRSPEVTAAAWPGPPAATPAPAPAPGAAAAAAVPALRSRALLRCGPAQQPEAGVVTGPGPVICEIPADIETLRRADPALARAWRRAVRAVLQSALAAGATITGFDRTAGYLLDGHWDGAK